MMNTETEGTTEDSSPSTEQPTGGAETGAQPAAAQQDPEGLPVAAEYAQQRAKELRAAAQEAEEAAEKLADAASAAMKANSTARTLFNAALWAGAVTLVGWGLNKLLRMSEEANDNLQRIPRGTEDADTEEPTAQPAEVGA